MKEGNYATFDGDDDDDDGRGRKLSPNSAKETTVLLVRSGEDGASKEKAKASSNSRWLCNTFLGVMAVGCILFGLYMVSFYIRSIVWKKLYAWDQVNPGMYHENRWDTNSFLSLHFIGGAYMMLFGPLQFLPGIRRNWINFHRWNGRLLTLGAAMFTSIGGTYYTLAVGVTSVKITGQTANWSTAFFGLAMFACGVETFRHAAWTKRIDQHKLWAYRLAGLCFGNLFARVYLLYSFMFLLDRNGNPKAGFGASIQILQLTFVVPFVLLADVVWTREQQGLNEGQESNSSGSSKILPALLVFVASSMLVVFTLGLALAFVFTWLPFMKVDLDVHPDSNYGF